MRNLLKVLIFLIISTQPIRVVVVQEHEMEVERDTVCATYVSMIAPRLFYILTHDKRELWAERAYQVFDRKGQCKSLIPTQD